MNTHCKNLGTKHCKQKNVCSNSASVWKIQENFRSFVESKKENITFREEEKLFLPVIITDCDRAIT